MSKKFGLGLAIGAMVGAVAGILSAPKSGEETRKDLKTKAKKVADIATEKTAKVASDATYAPPAPDMSKAIDATPKEKTWYEKVGEFAETTKQKADETAENVKKEAAKIQKRALNTIDGAKKGFEKKV